MGEKGRVLVVDDEPNNRALLTELLSDDFQVKCAETGEEALDRAADFFPNVILLDIMMPGINGYETCMRLRRNPDLRGSKIIMVSAKNTPAERLDGYGAGADDYLTKPFNLDELLAKVHVYMRLKSVEEVDQLKTDLLNLLCHETRTPLNGIIPPIRMAMEDEEMGHIERNEILGMALGAAERLQDLVEKSLTLSVMKVGKWNFRFESADLCEVVRKTVEKLSPRADEACLAIKQELPDSATIYFDHAEMVNVIEPLLDNAIRFSPYGGRVTVRLLAIDNGVIFSVTDEGDGLDPLVLPNVFDGFSVIDAHQTDKGHGLNLALVRQIVRAHNGKVGVESTQGSGTTFTVCLPRKPLVVAGDETVFVGAVSR